ncbi:Carboxylesterase [Frankia sp. AiPs1]|uniref:carboxylesterase/lipase family protein n=1 Tax=Frankia sp. AiPa1 TaxID=573492 RepID=UPI00202B727B|nr:carboxylesterase family protein [Frankia sp. AiPa1]MCL9758606.1 carboxylesterase family protein [Frankia sp. AiPa1]
MTGIAAGGSVSAGRAPEVRLARGALRGRREGGLAVFRGVPFAAPPVGALRFAAPQPPPSWDCVRPAEAFGPPPPQSEALGPAGSDASPAGADWLTANVWTPAPDPAAKLPVMVWIHGGAYALGASGRPEYDGGHLARDGRLVLVTFNYRLGVEGFAEIVGAPSNRGLLDQVAVLEWVRDDISAFGGDPDQVTIFGESAGGGSVAALLAMPRAVGLFRRAVAQSVPGTFFSVPLAADIAAVCAEQVGLRPTVADLAGADPALLVVAADLVAAEMTEWAGRWGQPAHRSILFAPVVDGDVLPCTPWQALAGGAGRGVGLLAGHTRDEQRLLTALSGLLGQVTPEQAADALRVFAPGNGGAPADGGPPARDESLGESRMPGGDGTRRYRDAYPQAGPDELYELVHSDWLFRMPTLHLAEAQLAGGGQAHVYELAWPAPGMGGILGACHGLDVPLVFGNLTRGEPAMLLGESPTAQAVALSAEMRGAWTGFATHGDPGWPAYDRDRRLTQVFDSPSAVLPYPQERSRRIWRNHSFPSLPLLGVA